jgi:hypothetical protein
VAGKEATMKFFDTPLGAAILRGTWLAIGTGAAAALTLYQMLGNVDTDAALAGVQVSPDRAEQALIAGLIAGLAALGFRGGIEGGMDQARRNRVEKAVVSGHGAEAVAQMNKSDVGYVVANPAAADPRVHG